MTSPTAPRRPSAAALTVALLGVLYYVTPLAAALARPGRQFSTLEVAEILLPGGLALAALWWLRARPLAVAALVTACLLPSPLALGPALVCVERIAATRRRAVTMLAAMLVVLAKGINIMVIGGLSTFAESPARVEWFLATVAVTIAVLVGMLNASNREAARRALEAEQARAETMAARINEARLAERERIAREMHDVVAHRISLVALHAGALAHGMSRAGGSPDELELVRLIQTNAQTSLEELRAMLTSLRGADAPPEPPQPSLTEVDALLTDARGAGQRIELTVDGSLARVPARISRHAYRLVQEGLTNARKHAPGAPTVLRLTASPTELSIRISNPLATLALPNCTGSGLGLVGMAERVDQLGGRLWHGESDGHFVLEALLPIVPEGHR